METTYYVQESMLNLAPGIVSYCIRNMRQYISRNITEQVGLKFPWLWIFIWWSSV